jgi:hypothetical protein
MPSTKDLDLLGSPIKLLLVAPNGMGKSIAAASFYKDGPICVEDADIRMKPVAAFYPGEDIEYNEWTSDNFHKFVAKIHDIISGRFKPEFKTWVIDSMTSFSITAVTYQLKIKDKIKTTKGGMPATSWDEINGETVFFHEMLEASQILYTKYGCNVIWTAHPVSKTEIVKGEDAKKVTSLAAYGNKIPSLVPGFFDEIYNLSRRKIGASKWQTVVHTVPNDNMPGKTALFNYLPETMDITDKNFFEVLKSHMEEK